MAGIAAKFDADFSGFHREVIKADTGLKMMTTTTAGTNTAIGGLHQGLSGVDRIMSSLGVNIGPQVGALREMAEVSGKTASQLGGVATAGLAVSVAFAGWQVGRYVADWLDLDAAIGNATASLLGWGDASAEAAGSRMDVLARASTIAGSAITDLALAMQIIAASNGKMSESFNTGAERVRSWNVELEKVRSAGALPALRAEILAGNSTLAQMKSHFNISIEALQFYERQLKQTGTEQAKFAAEARAAWLKMATAQETLRNAGEGWRETLKGIQPETVKVIEGYVAMGAPITAIAAALGVTVLQVKAVSNSWTELMTSMAKQEAAMVDRSKHFIETLVKNGAGYVEQSTKQLQQMQALIVLAAQLDQEFNQQAGPSAQDTLAEQTAGLESMRGQDGWSDARINELLNKLYESFYRKQGAQGNMPGTSYQAPSPLPGSSYTVSNTFNMNGILATTDPSGRAALNEVIRGAVEQGLNGVRR